MSRGGLVRAAASDDLTSGMMVGEYQIEGELGRGGMGRVYSAIHPVIAKRAAIKVLSPELSVNQEAVDRFVQEARSVNQIGHPNIVDIFAFGTMPDGRCFFVMEWLRGESLRDRMRKGVMPLADAMAFLETITLPLEAAHDVGIVHRDLKPDNVFLSDTKGAETQVKLLDFGIAKLLAPDAAGLHTNTGNMIGTPAYMSPEQARGQGVDHRTDIYALGVMTYEMLTGRLIFPADSAADMIAKHLFEQPQPIRTLNSNVPPPLEALVMLMLAKSADQRPTLAAARDVFRACRRFAQATPMPGTMTPSPMAHTNAPARRSRVWMIGLVAVVLLAGAGVGAWLVTRSDQQPAQTAPIPTPPTPNPASTASPMTTSPPPIRESPPTSSGQPTPTSSPTVNPQPSGHDMTVKPTPVRTTKPVRPNAGKQTVTQPKAPAAPAHPPDYKPPTPRIQ